MERYSEYSGYVNKASEHWSCFCLLDMGFITSILLVFVSYEHLIIIQFQCVYNPCGEYVQYIQISYFS